MAVQFDPQHKTNFATVKYYGDLSLQKLMRFQKLRSRRRRQTTTAVLSTDYWLKYAKEQHYVEPAQKGDRISAQRPQRQQTFQPCRQTLALQMYNQMTYIGYIETTKGGDMTQNSALA